MNFTRHPFGMPRSVTNWKEINEIAKTSWCLQETLRVSNSCPIVNVTLQRCLKAIGVESEMVYGVCNLQAGIKAPHVWLNIQGNVLDNTFVEDIPKPILFQMKKDAEYHVTSVRGTDDLYLGDHVTESFGIPDHDIKQFEWMLHNTDKTLALSKNKIQLDQYFDLMVKYVSDTYEVEVSGVPETLLKNCWTCTRSDVSLKRCGACKIAMYCGRVCQKKDRKFHKLVCLPPNSC